MVSILERLKNLSLRTKIMFTYTVIVFGLVFILSRISYYTIREIYLNQLSEQVNILCGQISLDLNLDYLEFITPEQAANTALTFYQDDLSEKITQLKFEQIFLFDEQLTIIVNSRKPGDEHNPIPALILNQAQIFQLPQGMSFTSEPFQSQDNQWYLWGFHRLSEQYFLGVQENANRLSRVNSISSLFILIGTVALLVTLAAGWLLANLITKPVPQLVHFSREIGRGNFKIDPPENIHGELKMLGAAMNKMKTDLVQHHEEKEKILAQIAHEIRNPLGGIELLAGLAREDMMKKELDPNYIHQILNEIRKLKTQLSEFLHYSRPILPTPEWIHPHQIIPELKSIIHNKLKKKELTLDSNLTDTKLWFDPGHLRQILLNLLVNAVEASPKNSEIKVNLSYRKNSYRIEIIDHGPGIADSDKSKIFEPFYSTKSNGIGLGLAICKKLCQENQAEISVSDNQGGGSIFTINKDLRSPGMGMEK